LVGNTVGNCVVTVGIVLGWDNDDDDEVGLVVEDNSWMDGRRVGLEEGREEGEWEASGADGNTVGSWTGSTVGNDEDIGRNGAAVGRRVGAVIRALLHRE
jgi:hypothetical protein